MFTLDASEIYDMAPLLGLLLWMFAIKFFPPEFQDVAAFAGFGIVFGFMFALDVLYIWRTAPFLFVESFLSPRNEKFRFYVKKPIESKEISEGQYSTKLSLAWPRKHPYYQKVEEVVIEHELPFEKRVPFQPGKAQYKGQWIGHANTTVIVLEEKTRGGSDIDHSSPIPIFRLKWGPGDYYLPEQMLATVESGKTPLEMYSGGNPEAKTVPITFDTIQKLKEAEDKLGGYHELQREAHDWHQKFIRSEQVIGQLKNELQAVLRSKADFKSSVVQYMLTIREAHLRIENALRALRGPRLGFTKYVAAVIISISVLIYLSFNPTTVASITNWISANQVLVIILAIIGGSTIYYLKRYR